MRGRAQRPGLSRVIKNRSREVTVSRCVRNPRPQRRRVLPARCGPHGHRSRADGRHASMKPGWDQLIDLGFDRGPYSDDPPGGTWSARIERSAWAKVPGIHLFVLHLGNAERFWLFVPYTRHELYSLFRDLPDGTAVELTIRRGVGGSLARILSAKSLEADDQVTAGGIPRGGGCLPSSCDPRPDGGGVATTRAVVWVRIGSVRRLIRAAGTARLRRCKVRREVRVKRRGARVPSTALPLSAFRIVTIRWMDDEDDDVRATEHIVHESHVDRFVRATLRLHYAPGINPHAGVRVAVARSITVGKIVAGGPYWWSTPSLQRQDETAGAIIFRGDEECIVWTHPDAPPIVTLCA
jgi:hypothetical protein